MNWSQTSFLTSWIGAELSSNSLVHLTALVGDVFLKTPSSSKTFFSLFFECEVRSHLEVIQEVEMRAERNVEDDVRPGTESNRSNHTKADKGNGGVAGFRPPSLEVLNHVKINVTPETPVSTLKNILVCTQSDLSFSKEEMRKVEEQMRQAFIEFYQQLRLLKSYW